MRSVYARERGSREQGGYERAGLGEAGLEGVGPKGVGLEGRVQRGGSRGVGQKGAGLAVPIITLVYTFNVAFCKPTTSFRLLTSRKFEPLSCLLSNSKTNTQCCRLAQPHSVSNTPSFSWVITADGESGYRQTHSRTPSATHRASAGRSQRTESPATDKHTAALPQQHTELQLGDDSGRRVRLQANTQPHSVSNTPSFSWVMTADGESGYRQTHSRTPSATHRASAGRSQRTESPATGKHTAALPQQHTELQLGDHSGRRVRLQTNTQPHSLSNTPSFSWAITADGESGYRQTHSRTPSATHRASAGRSQRTESPATDKHTAALPQQHTELQLGDDSGRRVRLQTNTQPHSLSNTPSCSWAMTADGESGYRQTHSFVAHRLRQETDTCFDF